MNTQILDLEKMQLMKSLQDNINVIIKEIKNIKEAFLK